MNAEEKIRLEWLSKALQHLAMTGQPCDVCTYSGRCYVDVSIDPEFIHALMYGAGVTKMAEVLSRIKLRQEDGNDSTVSLADIWMVYPMPEGGFTKAKLSSVNLSDANRRVQPSGETIREIIKKTYRPKDDKQLEYFLRRYLAS